MCQCLNTQSFYLSLKNAVLRWRRSHNQEVGVSHWIQRSRGLQAAETRVQWGQRHCQLLWCRAAILSVLNIGKRGMPAMDGDYIAALYFLNLILRKAVWGLWWTCSPFSQPLGRGTECSSLPTALLPPRTDLLTSTGSTEPWQQTPQPSGSHFL